MDEKFQEKGFYREGEVKRAFAGFLWESIYDAFWYIRLDGLKFQLH
jgi:hypothetical protein